MTEITAAVLDGTAYTSTGTEGHDLVPDSSVRMSFEDGRLSVQAGCNTMGAGYDVSDGRLGWSGPPMATRMACPEELMAQDTWLSDLLQAGLDATLDGDDLTLLAGEVTLRLRRRHSQDVGSSDE